MCTIICTVRTVLWYVMSVAGTLMILVSLFTNKWLQGTPNVSNAVAALDTITDTAKNFLDDGQVTLERNVGLFIDCLVRNFIDFGSFLKT